MLITNGRIYSMDGDPRRSVVDTLVVRDGRVLFAGRRGEANGSAAEPVLDIGGRAVLPGLVDGHAHLLRLARARLTLDAGGPGPEEEIARRVGVAAARMGAGEWVIGGGWDQTRWPDQRFPTRASLDRAAPGTPVALLRVDGHATWASSAALGQAGITRTTPDPAGGRIVKDERGEPTGLLIDAAQRPVQDVQPSPSEAQFDSAVRDAIAECLAKGLTGIHEMGVDLPGLASYRRLVERGQFPFRNYAAVHGRSVDAWDYYRERGPEVIGDGQVTVRALKLLADGALGSRGAALHAPYCDDPGNTGLMLIPPEEIERLAREAASRGFQVCVHAIGDRANTMVLDVFARVLAGIGSGPARRFRVEHAQVLADSDLGRFHALGVLPSMQPMHCVSDMRWAGDRLGAERLRRSYAWRSLLDTGVIIPGGSDFPVEDANPFHGLHAAVTRRPLTGEDRAVDADQRMTRGEAVRAFTVWNAYASHQERDLGTLVPGRRADLVVLSHDVFTCPESAIKDVQPVLTMVGGQVVFARSDALR
jgi:predicted amidohydrolase YtcJ